MLEVLHCCGRGVFLECVQALRQHDHLDDHNFSGEHQSALEVADNCQASAFIVYSLELCVN